MVRLSRTALTPALAAAAIAATACSDASAPDRPVAQRVVDLTPTPIISEAGSGGDPHFFWLPPVSPVRVYPGTFDAAATPDLRICPFANDACTVAPTIYTLTSSPAIVFDTRTPAFSFNWSTKSAGVSVGDYRAEVRLLNRVLGFADLRVVGNAKDLKNVPAGFVGVQDGKSLTLAFRIENGIVGSVRIFPRDSVLTIGGVRQFNAQVLDIHGAVISGAPVAWTSRSPAVATISATGLATGVSTGVTTIVATSGVLGDSTFLTVRPVPVSRIVVYPSGIIPLNLGQSFTFSDTTFDASGHILPGRAVTWSTNNPSVVTIGSDGRATATGPGLSFVVATSEGKRDSAFVDVTSGATVTCLRPWTLPEIWFLPNVVGRRVTGRYGATSTVPPAADSGQYYPLQLTGTSGATYTSDIVNCSAVPVTLGDSVDLAVGNLVSPTVTGLDGLFALDPNAAWDPAANGGQGGIVGSNAPPGSESARVVQAALYIFNGQSVGASRIAVRRTAFVFIESYVKVSTPPASLRGDITFRFLRFGP